MDGIEAPSYLEQIYGIEMQKKSELQSLKRQLGRMTKQASQRLELNKGDDESKSK